MAARLMLKIFFRVWQKLPLWTHVLAARVIQPKFQVGVAALIFDEQGRVLLFKHTYRKFEWGIPGGTLEYNEQPDRAMVREFYEETGMQIQIQTLLQARSSKGDRHVSLIYLCEIESGTFKESAEISEIRYFSLDGLPAMLFAEKEAIWRAADLIGIKRSGESQQDSDLRLDN
ncbi:MAG: NUDIX domain-containing protein [Anaerolineae bacterium]|nr:NUDIX domain-containing protein [Anaerolineae bacterium]MDL1925182.1 NUDIX domain-containing protein [Anaerolineae bacterium AMX1]